MDSAELSTLIDTYGAAVDAWPLAARRAAGDLLAASPDARAMLARAVAMERALRRPPAGEEDISSGRVERVIALAMAQAKMQARTMPDVASRPWPLAGVLGWLSGVGDGWLRYAMPMALGAVLGILVGHVSVDRAAVVQTDGVGLTALLEAFHTEGWFGS